MKKLLVLSLILLGLFAAQGEAQTLCIGPNCPGAGGGGGGTDLTIGVSTITGGTNARVLYDNGGVVGEYPITGTGNVVLSTAPRFGGTVNFGTASTTTGSIAMFKAGSAFGVTIGTTDQTVGSVALTIPDFASVADTFVFTTLAQTLSNKTFVAPALGTPSSGVMTNVTGTASGLTAGAATLAISTSALKSATTTVNVDAATAPSAGQVLTATDSTHATWQAGGSSTITSGTTATSGCVAGGVVYSISNLVKCDGNFTFDNNLLTIGNVTTAGRAIIKTQDTITGSSATSNFLNITGALPASVSGPTYGAAINMTSGATPTGRQYGLYVNLTGNAGTYQEDAAILAVANNTNGGALQYGIIGRATPPSGGSYGAVGVFGQTNYNGTNQTVFGVKGTADGGNGATSAIGVGGFATSSFAQIPVAGFFSLGDSWAVPSVATAVLADNLGIAGNLVLARDNSAAIPTTGATATWRVMDGAIPQVGTGVLTTATMAAEAQAYARGSMVHSATWTNAQVVALGASLTGDIKAFTIPAKHVVENAYIIITGAAAGTTTLTVSCGRTSASYIDYIVASDAQAAANTVYGGASAERGTNLTGYDLPSYTGTTDVYCHFTSTVSNLSSVTGSTGRVVLVTTLIP